MKATIVTVGDELLIGQVVDTNSAWIGQQLTILGVEVLEILSISDTVQAIKDALDRAYEQSDIILMTGGLGPTKDDITKKTIAEYFNEDMYFDEAVYNRIQRFFTKLGRTPLESHRLQCYMPMSATILRNNMGTAPGMLFRKKDKLLISMPGVPYEMKFIMVEEVLPLIQKEGVLGVIYNKTIRTAGRGESQIAETITEITDRFPEHITIAFLPGLGQVRLRITGNGTDYEVIKSEVDAYVAEIALVLEPLVFGYDEDTLPIVIGNMLMSENKRLALAESCTGGYLSHMITSIPGSSQYYDGSVVVYSYELKEKILGVNPLTLKSHGAVSEEVVIEMVEGCVRELGVNFGISISGIAGPGGGTPEKPVGTIWMAVSDGTKTITKKLSLSKSREINIKYTSSAALILLWNFLKGRYV